MGKKNKVSFLKMISDETRLEILELLSKKELCVCEIFPKVNRTQSTVSIQLGKLEKAGIIESRKDGKKKFYKFCCKKTKKIINLL
jgi:ArsR family transcriptional regulator, arsenate/arsenite/antimonite-responsive transcriptional repressor